MRKATRMVAALFGLAAGAIALLAMLGGLASMLWYLLIARRLFQLASSITPS